jgi:Bax protein
MKKIQKTQKIQIASLFLSIIMLLSIILVTSKTSHVATPDFRAIENTQEKKKAFFDYLLPYIAQANNTILALRHKIIILQEKDHISKKERRWLTHVSQEYGLNSSSSELNFAPLLERVDIIPPSLVLAQAANESAWGTSKFARLANNYFGQWCFTLHCGMVPSRRDSGKTHEVQKFTSPYDSVRAYLLNLNTNKHYALLRSIRSELRSQNKPLRGDVLATGLVSYSERGHDYIEDIQAMISMNQLEQDDVG